MKEFSRFLKELSPSTKQKVFLLFSSYFLVLLSYPLIRSSASAIFYEYYKGSDYSFAVFLSVIALAIVIQISNYFQRSVGVHRIFLLVCILTSTLLLVSNTLLQIGIKEMAYLIFSLKEAYIVILIHLALAYGNNSFSLKELKRLYGPLGAIGSLGGILGGQLAAYLASNNGTTIVFNFALIIISLAAIPFYLTIKYDSDKSLLETASKDIKVDQNLQISPLRSIHNIKKYVFFIGMIVMLTQWVVYVADLQFNLSFSEVVTSKSDKTVYLGNLYSSINVITLIVQFLILPYLLVRVKTKKLFYFVPISYLLLILLGIGSIGVYGVSLILLSSIFVSMKAIDYSLASVIKEIIYHPLRDLQKYGAKYITDMFVYRFSKALIALVFVFLGGLSINYLSFIQVALLSVWILIINLLFIEQKKIISKNKK